jgi:hypothetical protein
MNAAPEAKPSRLSNFSSGSSGSRSSKTAFGHIDHPSTAPEPCRKRGDALNPASSASIPIRNWQRRNGPGYSAFRGRSPSLRHRDCRSARQIWQNQPGRARTTAYRKQEAEKSMQGQNVRPAHSANHPYIRIRQHLGLRRPTRTGISLMLRIGVVVAAALIAIVPFDLQARAESATDAIAKFDTDHDGTLDQAEIDKAAAAEFARVCRQLL